MRTSPRRARNGSSATSPAATSPAHDPERRATAQAAVGDARSEGGESACVATGDPKSAIQACSSR